MAQHTPGPWTVAVDRRGCRVVLGPSGERIAQLMHSAAAMQWAGETEYNAGLIAASPDLLAACKAAVASYDVALKNLPARYGCVYKVKQNRLKAVIAKAEGRE